MHLFKKPAFLFLFVSIALSINCQAATDDSLLNQLGRKWQNAAAYTVKVAEQMPAEFYNFKPVPEEMSFRQQLLHIAKNIHWLSSSYLLSTKKAGINDSLITDKSAVIQAVQEAYDEASAVHKNLPAKSLDELVSFFAGPMTRRQILLLLHDHQTHHVGQLIVYLRLKGIVPPPYVGW